MSQNLIKKIRSYIELNKEEEQFISSVFKLKYFAKGEHFLLAGDVCRESAFIESRVFRFYINTDERDATYYFAAETESIGASPVAQSAGPDPINRINFAKMGLKRSHN